MPSQKAVVSFSQSSFLWFVLLLFILLNEKLKNGAKQLSFLVKNKIQLSKFEDLVGFIQQFMNQAASHLQVEGSSQELCKMKGFRASLVVQWLRIRLPMQGTRVRALVREDPTCHRATKPVHHNY